MTNTDKFFPRLLSKLRLSRRFLLRPDVLRIALGGHNIGLYLGLRQPWLQRFRFRTVVDIGANVGQFALLARKAFSGAALHCFEPLPDCFAELSKRLGQTAGVTLHNVALAEHDGEETMTRNPYSPSSSLLEMAASHVKAFPFTAGGNPLRVSVLTLDEALDRYTIDQPLLVKIDVQGAEDRVIAGGQSVLARAAVVIVETSFEALYKEQALFGDIHAAMRALGFTYHGNIDQLASPDDGRVLQGDAVFVRTE